MDGFAQVDYPMMVSGAVLVMMLTLTSDGLFAVAQRRAVSRGLRAERTGPADRAPRPHRASVSNHRYRNAGNW